MIADLCAGLLFALTVVSPVVEIADVMLNRLSMSLLGLVRENRSERNRVPMGDGWIGVSND